MKKIISLLLVGMLATFVGCVKNNRNGFQPSTLKTKHRTVLVD